MAAKKKKSSSKPSPEKKQGNAEQPGDESNRHTLQFPIVGIGASAGGLDALKRFFSAMPPDSELAFIVVPHLDPSHRSLMVELLARQSTMTVCEARDGMPIERNCVYIIPPNRDLSISSGLLRVSATTEHRGSYTVLDRFFRSLAEDQQEMSIGIVLSGTGSHGTPGLKEIKAVGGMVMAQDPGTAEYDQMPQNAIDTGMVDYILPPEKMPEALIKYVRHPYLYAPKPMVAEAVAAQIAPVLDLLHTTARYDFRFYRKNMLNRRIQRRMGICQIDSVTDYVVYLREHPEEMTALSRDLLIGVTAFFRDPDAFQVLHKQVIAELVERQTSEFPIRVWVPACATGEEAYSIAILLLEQYAADNRPPNFQIFASDIDEESVGVARRGIYAASDVGELSPERVQQFFVKTDEIHYQVNKQLRGSIVVTRQNVISDAPFSKLDLISCRNLLIYLEPELQQKLLSLFHFALREQGSLFLGCSESIGQHTDLFEPVSKKWRVYRRIGPARHDLVQVPIIADEGRRIRVPKVESGLRPRVSFVDLMQTALLAQFAPAAVLINRKYEVLSLFGRTSDYLELPTGEPTRDLMSLARQGLRTKIRAACHKVLSSGDAAATIDARISRNGVSVVCTITIRLLDEPVEAAGLLLVTFQDRPQEEQPSSSPDTATVEESAVVRQLEHEVETTREELQNTIEELQSSNEEVMSMNEELQSANEELETSKEELQSFNEELTTVNNQLQDKVDELERANNDFQNLLDSTQIATVFLDTDLRIKRFTPATVPLLHLIETDVGRPIRDIALRFTDPALIQDAARVLQSSTPVETEIRSDEGRSYLRRVLPYRTAKNKIEGVAIAFVDITERIQAEAQARRLAAVLQDSSDAIMVLDLDGRITAWNRGAEQLYGYTEAEALQRQIGDLAPEDARAEQEAVIGRVARGEKVDSFEIRRVSKDGRLLDVWSTVTRLTDDQGHSTAIALTSRDITEWKQARQELLRREREFKALVENDPDIVARFDRQCRHTYINPAIEEITGLPRSQFLGKTNRELGMPERLCTVWELAITEVFETWQQQRVEFAFASPDKTRYFLSRLVPEFGAAGQVETVLAVTRDISDRIKLQRELLTIVSEKQRHIALDLHDSVGQKLTGLGMLAGSLAGTLQQRSPADADTANRIARGVEEALGKVRKLSRGLHPVDVDAEGLRAALAELADTTNRDSGVKCNFDCDQPVRIEDNEVATHLYRIAQEAVTNALKHGVPKHVTIRLARDETDNILSVRDDGKGISTAALKTQGIGLKTMQYRAALIGADLSISPIKKRGTLVTCRLPENRNHGKTPTSGPQADHAGSDRR